MGLIIDRVGKLIKCCGGKFRFKFKFLLNHVEDGLLDKTNQPNNSKSFLLDYNYFLSGSERPLGN